MIRSSKSFVPVVSLTVLAGLAVAVGTFTALALYSRPANFDARVASLQDRIAEITRLSKPSAKARAYVPGALCPSAADGAVEAISATLRARADQLGLQTSGISAQASDEVNGGVVRVALRGEFSGSYPAALALLDQLANQTPKVFADQVDLLDRAPQVSLRFSGHFYCSTVN